MVAVGPNMFYTVTLPVTLWFLDRGKKKTPRADTIFFLDARHQSPRPRDRRVVRRGVGQLQMQKRTHAQRVRGEPRDRALRIQASKYPSSSSRTYRHGAPCYRCWAAFWDL